MNTFILLPGVGVKERRFARAQSCVAHKVGNDIAAML